MREIHIIRLKKSLMFLAVVVSLIFLIDRFDLPIDKNLHASVYAAIFTLAAITGSLITIISGTLSKKIFDIPMDVFLHLNVYLFDPLYLLLLSVMIVAFSTLTFLLNGLLATLFYLALELIYIALFSAMMWKMATSERFCIRLLEKEIHMRDKKANWKYILGCLFSYYGREIVCTAATGGYSTVFHRDFEKFALVGQFEPFGAEEPRCLLEAFSGKERSGQALSHFKLRKGIAIYG